jgi:hypothetical protein
MLIPLKRINTRLLRMFIHLIHQIIPLKHILIRLKGISTRLLRMIIRFIRMF